MTGSVAEYYELLADRSHEGRALFRQYEASEAVWMEVIKNDPDQVDAVILNKKLPFSVLAALAAHEDWRTRCSVADKRRTPSWILAQLADDPNEAVRFAVAGHRNATAECLQALTKDPCTDVRERAAERLEDRQSK